MNAPLPRRLRAARERGAGLIEIMVGVLIGMIVVAVVYNLLVVAEGYKRMAIGVADAQVTGQLTQFIVGRELANAGNALATATDELAVCGDWRLKPLPAVIRAGATANDPDDLTLFYSTSPRVVHPVYFAAAVAPPNPLPIYSPNGFKVNDWFIATDRTANCSLGQVTGITQFPSGNPWPPADSGGGIQLAYTPASAFSFTPGSRIINLGPQVNRVHYMVNAAKAQLESQNVNPGAGVQPVVPLAQNVVLLKAQYGIDTNGDGNIDCWTPADNAGTCGAVDYSGPSDPATALGGGVFAPAATAAQIRGIKAIRVAIVVRSEDVARTDATNASLVNQTAWLFNCAANNATCQSRIQIDNTVLNDYGRYRIYESTIPLRNSLWNQP